MPKIREITFEEFWKKYPLHKSKGPAERAWNRLTARERLAAFNGIERYIEYCRSANIAFKYAQGWLNDRRWTDEYDDEQPSARPMAAPSEPLPTEMEIW